MLSQSICVRQVDRVFLKKICHLLSFFLIVFTGVLQYRVHGYSLCCKHKSPTVSRDHQFSRMPYSCWYYYLLYSQYFSTVLYRSVHVQSPCHLFLPDTFLVHTPLCRPPTPPTADHLDCFFCTCSLCV